MLNLNLGIECEQFSSFIWDVYLDETLKISDDNVILFTIRLHLKGVVKSRRGSFIELYLYSILYHKYK
jgi:hypothetical protein